MSSCRNTYEQVVAAALGRAANLNDAAWADIERMAQSWRKAMDTAGVRPSDVVGTLGDSPVSVLDDLVNTHVANLTTDRAKAVLHEYASNRAVVAMQSDIQRIADKMPKKDGTEKIAALRNLILRAADWKTDRITLEDNTHFQFSQAVDKLRQRVNGAVDNLGKWLTDEANHTAMIDEFFTPGISGNTTAHAVANALRDTLGEIDTRLVRNGYTDGVFSGIQPTYNWSKIRTWVDANGEEQFTKYLADRMGGDAAIETKTLVAKSFLQTMKDNNGTIVWADVGNGASHSPSLKDGQAWREVNDLFGEKDFNDTVLAQLKRSTNKLATVELFGPNPQKTFERLLDWASSTDSGRTINATRRGQAARNAETEWIAMTGQSIPQNQTVDTALRMARQANVASKLGSASVAAINDVGIMSFQARHLYGVSPLSNVSHILAGFTDDTAKQYAARAGIALDHFLHSFESRFGADGDMLSRGALDRGIARTAELTMKLSGLNWWTDGMRSGVTGMFRHEFGDLVGRGAAWGDLHPKMQASLERFGIGEARWGNIVQERPLTQDGLFDFLALSDDKLRRDMSAFIKDAADNLILTPGARDSHLAAWYGEPGSVNESVLKTLMLFKSYPITMFRRVVYRNMIAEGGATSMLEKVGLAAELVAITSTINALAIQLRETAKGNQPYNIDSPELWTKAVTTGGAFGIMSDTFMSVGGDELFKLLTGQQPESVSSAAGTLLGPVFGDFLKLADVTLGTAGTAGAAALGMAEGDDVLKQFGKLTRFALGQVPGQSLWWARGAYRALLVDSVWEYTDPRGYRASIRKLRDSEDERIGGQVRADWYTGLEGLAGR